MLGIGDGLMLRPDPLVLSDSRFSADTMHSKFPHPSAGFEARREQFRTFIVMDDPEHARQRRMLTGDFAIKRTEALRPKIQDTVDRLIADLLAGDSPADLVRQFSEPLPSLVICEILGVPFADHEFFQDQTRVMASRDTEVAESVAAGHRLHDYLRDLLLEKNRRPTDGVLSRLAVNRLRTGELNVEELTRMAQLMVTAGHETTANMISLGTRALLRNPDQLALLRESDDPRLVAGAVEELLRYLSVTTGRRRVALEDVEVGGQLIRAGEGVIVDLDTAKRDSTVFDQPERLDLRRNARQHVAFGFGAHQCLGQSLARVELQVVHGTLFRRVPSLRLAAETTDIQFKDDAIVYGVYELPVAW
jgi:cytochrome P450